MSVQFEEYMGQKILFIDFSGLRDQAYMDAIEEAESEILKYKPGEISTITNVNNTFTTEKLKARFEQMSEKTKGITKARVVIGFNGIKKVIARFIRKDIYFAGSVNEAKEWLANND